MEDIKKYLKYVIILLSLNFLFITQVLSAECTDVSGTTVTISADCEDLDISGSGANVTINSGVTISETSNASVGFGGYSTTLTNNGTISSDGSSTVLPDKNSTITTLTNNGTISTATNGGITNNGTISTLENTGTISATVDKGLLNNKVGTFGTITNSGTISAGDDYGIINYGAITTITNSGTISAVDDYGIWQTSHGTITTITNSGTISAGGKYGIFVDNPIGTITNSGTITATGNYGLYNKDTITLLTNSDTISSSGDAGLANHQEGTITTLTNSGDIKALGDDFGLKNRGTIVTLTNSGTISAADDSGLWNDGTITTLTNEESGTIKALGDLYGLKNVNGTISTLTNSGTISSVAKYGLYNDSSTISTLTNSGTISSARSGLWNDGTITMLTNSGTIKATTGDYGLKNVNGGLISTLNNSGTISAGDETGIYNDDTSEITTLTNTGTISAAGNSIGIHNDSGTITTLNNSQGASGSALTYKGTLPANYNVIFNSTSDFGKITFSNVSGITAFGIDSSSTLAADTTYSSVIEGLASSNITNTNGYITNGDSIRQDWTLENSSGTTWDLVVDADIDMAPDTNTSVANSTKTNVISGINNLASVTEVNFAHMNTYDCDLFNENNACLSFGGRHTTISNPTTSTNSFVLVGGYKFNKNLRIAGFYHKNLIHNTPSTFELRDKTPLYGALIVWNEHADKSGYQLKFSNAYQSKSAILIRDIVGSSEQGKGYTEIEAQSYIAELQYSYKIVENSILSPYFATKISSVQQEGFTEVGLSSPLTFNRIKDSTGTIVGGLKFNIDMTTDLTLRGSIGVEYDVIHKVDKIEPKGMTGLSTVSLENEFNPTKPVLSLALDNYLSSNEKITTTLQYQELSYKSKAETNVYVYYTIGL